MEQILIISYYWPPAGGPGVQRWLKMAKYIEKFGLKPIVLTVDPSLATYPLRDESLLEDARSIEVIHTTTKELFNLYKKTSGRKEVPFSGFANESNKPGPRQRLSRWVRGNLLLPDPRRGWNKYAFRKASELIRERNIKFVVTTSPPHSSQLIGLKLKAKFPSLHWLADFRDPWTDIYYYDQFYPTALAKAYDARLERNVLREADTVISVSRDFIRLLSSKVEASRDKFLLLPNGYDAEDFSKGEQLSPDQEGPLHLVYTGTLSSQYPIEALLKALEKQHKASPVKLSFYGMRDQRSEELLRSYPFVELNGSVSHERVISIMQAADMLLLVMPDIASNRGIVPGKIYEYMAAKRPILGIGPVGGDADELLRSTDAGRLFHYGDQAGMAEFIRQRPSLQFQVEDYSREALAKRLAECVLSQA